MKRLRSSDELDSYGEKITSKESSNPNPNRSSSSSHRSFYYKSENARKGLVSPSSSSSRYDRDRSLDDDSRNVRKRSDHDFESFDRRKGGFDRYSSRDGGGGGGGNDRVMHRSESFCGSRREFPKGFRSERDRRREGSMSSWRRFGSERKEFEESNRGSSREERGGSGKGGLRDMMKSPSWSRDSGSEQSRVRGFGGDSRSKSKSKSRSSPTWSKDSVGSEQSKNLEVAKKSEEVKIESGCSSSEMEEGELEPDVERERLPDAVPKEVQNENEAKDNAAGVEDDDKEFGGVADKVLDDVEKEGSKESVCEGKKDGLENRESPEEKELPDSGNLNVESGDDEEGKENLDDDENEKEEENVREEQEGLVRSSECTEEGSKDMDMVVEKSTCVGEESKEEKGIDLEVKAEEEIEAPESNKDQVVEENKGGEVKMYMETEGLNQNFKDKGKSVAVTPVHAADSAEDGGWIERESRVAVTWKADDMEGPSTRGFELFTTSPVRKAEEKAEPGVNNKEKDEKLALEPLDLSLSLPNVLLPIGARDSTLAPGSPSHGRSIQSLTNTFRTNSDGFTASMSFSGSQSFFHNPSCSLTQNSMDNFEQSVHSRPIFQGIDQVSQGAWQGQSQNESSRHKEIPLYQRILMNGNGSIHQSQTSFQGIPNGQLEQGQHVRVTEGSNKVPNGPERQLSFHKQTDVRSPSNSVGSHEIGSSYSFERKRAMREKHGGGSLYRSNSQKEQELISGVDSVETIIGRIVSDPFHVMARKFRDMTGQSIASVKERIREIMLNADKKAQLRAVQNALQYRSDMNIEVLQKCHRAQLEILVALKTGIPEYLQLDNAVSSTDLAEVFLNLRCRNVICRNNPLPVDECDCKVCSKKNGFCNACMCLVCSKFDMASKTCSWVGCDVCLHWCHADCGLRESYIRNGRSSVSGAQGSTEMQFHCVACDHPSEMFGFVKEVFQTFAKEWSAETMSRELEYVKRIFSASKDVRGRRLHEIADHMLVRLSNKSDLPEVFNYIMGFLTDSESSKYANTLVFSEKEPVKGSNGIAGPSQDSSWLKSVYSDKAPQLEGSTSLLPSFHIDRNDKHPVELDLHKSSQKEPLFDELESIVRIKLAEAEMFQVHADNARRDAEGLKRIAIAKNEKIEEEYTSRITKLRLVEAEEMRKQKFEEFQSLETAHREYFSMKMRMEADIKDLLLKMEATRRNLAM